SRLAYELVQRLRRRPVPPSIWIGRGDPISAGSAFNLLGQALRGAVGIVDGDPLPARRSRLRARVEQRLGAEADRVVDFLGELLPRLWAGRGLHEVELRELPRRAGERLVRRVLGEGTAAETVRDIVERADGNAFYLEELIRAVAEGKGGAMPETVLAMVQARL